MKLNLLLLFFLPLWAFGQILNIEVSDSISGEVLPYANLYMKKSGIGTTTNMDGIASFDIAKLSKSDTMIVSYIGYVEKAQWVVKIDKETPLKVKLIPSFQYLDELVVIAKKTPKPEKIIKKAIQAIKKNYSTDDVILKSLYRETIFEEGPCIQLNEAYLKTYYTSYPQKKMDSKIWMDWYYDASYAFEVEGDKFFKPLLKDFNTKQDKQRVLGSRRSENWSNWGINTTIIGDPLLILAFDKIKYLYDFFNPKVLNKYTFNYEGKRQMNGELCFVLSFYPKSNDRRFVINMSRKNKSAIYIGQIYISCDSYALVNFQYKLAVERDFGFFQNRMPLDYFVEMNYKKNDGLWFIDNVKFSETKQVGEKQNGESILHTVVQEIFVLGVQQDNIMPFPDSSIFKSTAYSSLRYYNQNYNPAYWNNLTEDEIVDIDKSIINDLEKEKTLDEQFKEFEKNHKKKINIPKVQKIAYSFNYHQEESIDSLQWMAMPEYEYEFKEYLGQENEFAKNEFVEDKKYQRKLFHKLDGFYKNREDTLNTHKANSYYWEMDSLQNMNFTYKNENLESTNIFNLTLFKETNKNVHVTRVIPNKKSSLLFIQYSKQGEIGDRISIFPFKENIAVDSLNNIYSAEWFNDSVIVFSDLNKQGRAENLQAFNTSNGLTKSIYSEKDSTFDVEIQRLENNLICTVQSKTENEIYLIDNVLNSPKLKLLKQRKSGILNSVRISDKYYFLVKDDKGNSYIKSSCFNSPEDLSFVAISNKRDYIEDFDFVGSKIVAVVYEQSVPKLKIYNKRKRKWDELKLNLGIGRYALLKPKGNTSSIRFLFSSPSKANHTYEYNLTSKELKQVSESLIKRPYYYKNTYVSRVWAKSDDKTKIPITIVQNVATSGYKGLILKAYGAYGTNVTPYFDAQDAILLSEGFTIAYAHVRGGSVLGLEWYKKGRVLNKKNSYLDYLACAEYLIKKGLTTSSTLIAYGNSAGGLVVGQAVNERPELFNAVILDHAYLDVINTMMNDTLPLTVDEYKEWGNPNNKEVFDYMMDYSPYQNIKKQKYPQMLFIASYYDYQTPSWQIAKCVPKLRENNLAGTKILLLTDMNSGHIGNTTGKEWIKLFSKKASFIHQSVRN